MASFCVSASCGSVEVFTRGLFFELHCLSLLHLLSIVSVKTNKSGHWTLVQFACFK